MSDQIIRGDNITITIHSGPDEKGRYVYTSEWFTSTPAFCSDCGKDHLEYTPGLITCRDCGYSGPKFRRGQVSRAELPHWAALILYTSAKTVDA